MGNYEIVLHLRDSTEPLRLPLRDVEVEAAEADREQMMAEIEHARLAEAPKVSLRAAGAPGSEPIELDPHDVTDVDLIDLPSDEL
jgi:hypothetical protein